jgi:hypothetical protein
MKWLFRLASQRALAKGGDRWVSLTFVLGLLRVVRKLAGAEPRTLYKHTLREGEVFVVREEKTRR